MGYLMPWLIKPVKIIDSYKIYLKFLIVKPLFFDLKNFQACVYRVSIMK